LSSHIRGKPCPDPVAILNRFRAGHLLDRFPKTLSGGERCRASLAQAAVANPRILLLDEPFTGLDTFVKEDVAEALFQFARDEGAAVLFVTHDLEDARHYAQRAVVIAAGQPSVIAGVVRSDEDRWLERIRELIGRTP
jgi:ABC-type nitrate/sulfonate/bicarbonate transport system ATPase subunit